MSQLVLQPNQIDSVKKCWTRLQDNNKYHNDTFTSRLYSNLLINNPDLSHSVFHDNDKEIKQHSLLFGDLLEFIINYADDSLLCDEFVDQFFKDNQDFCNDLVKYIEQMGSSFIITFKQWLGPQFIDMDLEGNLIKIFCFIANYLLQNGTSTVESSDVDSTFSQEKPLMIQKQSTPDSDIQSNITQKTAASNISNAGSTISFSLNKNDKYKGFRRSVNENYSPNNEPVSIKIPGQYTSPTSSLSTGLSSRLSSLSSKSDFDPRSRRSYRSNEQETVLSSNASIVTTTDTMVTAASEVSSLVEEPRITPRSAKRDSALYQQRDVPSLVKKLNNRESKFVEFSDSDEDCDTTITTNFDPRKKRSSNHKRNNSVDLDSSISEEETPVIPERSLARGSTDHRKHDVFDSNSFGIKGLAPIVEADYDDTASSRYESEDDSHSKSTTSDGTDVISSGASTLSLNGARSSVSSGTEAMSPSPDFKSQQHPHTRTSSGSSSISYMKPLSQPRALPPSSLGNMNPKLSRSTSSLLSEYSNTTGNRNRVSMGFMRSSFVLKKEMEELGFNMPENVTVAAPAPEVRSEAPPAHSQAPLPVRGKKVTPVDDSFQYLNSFGGSDVAIPHTNKAKPVIKEKKSFGSKLRSMFSKSKTTEKAPEPPVKGYSLGRVSTSGNEAKKYATSIQASYVTSNSYGNPYESNHSDRGSVSQSSKKLREPLARPPKNFGYGYSMHSQSTSDVASIRSAGSSVSGFSFFGGAKDNGLKRVSTRSSYISSTTRTGNKYKVKAVPYNVFSRGV